MDLTVYEVVNVLNNTQIHMFSNEILNKKINKIKIDSRKIVDGDFYIPIVGENFDGHDFISDSFKNGAIISISQKNIKELNCKDYINSIIFVKNTKESLQKLAKYYRKKMNVKILGITGSVGKSSTKEMIASVLSTCMNVLKTDKNYNGQLGVPLTLFNINKNHEIVVLEMGISIPGEMDILCDIADPDFAIITNIGISHLANFKTIENICEEKLKILNKNKNAILYLNNDDEILKNLKFSGIKRIKYFGINGEYKISNIKMFDDHQEFIINNKNNIKISYLGNISNIICTITFCIDFGINIKNILEGLKNFKNLPMRQEIKKLNNITLIDDSYNASPDSLKSAIEILENLESSDKKAIRILIFADIKELGDESEKIHKDLGKLIFKKNINIIITIGDFAKEFAKAASDDINKSIFICNCIDEAFENLLKILKPINKYVILVKGSRAMKLENLILKIKNIKK